MELQAFPGKPISHGQVMRLLQEYNYYHRHPHFTCPWGGSRSWIVSLFLPRNSYDRIMMIALGNGLPCDTGEKNTPIYRPPIWLNLKEAPPAKKWAQLENSASGFSAWVPAVFPSALEKQMGSIPSPHQDKTRIRHQEPFAYLTTY